MRSKELADFAGVTVRTLRHWHQMGLLPEPPRAENGYRAYGAVDLTRVLRIKRLASLGIPLQQVAEMFAAEYGDARTNETQADQVRSTDETLAALDAELAAQIERLQEQRRVIAELRERAIDPDVPPLFGEHVARLRGAGASDGLVDHERSGLLLVDRFFDEASEEAEAVSQFFDLVAQADSVESYVEFNERMLALSSDASQEECESLAGDFVAFMVPILRLGCERFNWDLSAKKIEALACSPDFAFAQRRGEGACGRGERPRCDRVSAPARESSNALSLPEETRALDLLLDLYDNETLNDAQRMMNDRVTRGILDALSRDGGKD